MRFAKVLLPIPLPAPFSYEVPDSLRSQVLPGMRVLVPFGRGLTYKGLVLELTDQDPGLKQLKSIAEVLDPFPLVNDIHVEFWRWMAEYYMCTLGEVFRAAFPRGLKQEYKPRLVTFVGIEPAYQHDNALGAFMDTLKRAPVQLKLLQDLAALALENDDLGGKVPKTALAAGGNFSASAYNALKKKRVINESLHEVSRLDQPQSDPHSLSLLNAPQDKALSDLRNLMANQQVTLLKGVTSSGKTELYLHLMADMLARGKQVLYLLPEIALTAQIVERIRKVFGAKVSVYHSRYSDTERVETFLRVKEQPGIPKFDIILGARSSIFLPFSDLGLIIIDEEHEPSYKQEDPAPRYHARDAAIVLAEKYGAKVLLGSATPSLESQYNARTGKYARVELNERYGDLETPEVHIANIREAYRKKQMRSHFTPLLLDMMAETLAAERQVILFQNRRGFSPYIECFDCGWIPVCRDCDVNLTYHKAGQRLVCHYCGYSLTVYHDCPDCGNSHLVTRGFGTEKLEEETGLMFPDVRLARMDMDTTRTRRKYERLIRDFENGYTRILIGTQIVTKGLDFEKVSLVGVLNADNLLNFPDFRSVERTYQLLSQVGGRAGRKDLRGQVVIQTSQPDHPVIRHILHNDYRGMYMDQMRERQEFHYPPYYRLIRISLSNMDPKLLEGASKDLAGRLKTTGNIEVLGPQSPLIGRIQKEYISNILVKLPRRTGVADLKSRIRQHIDTVSADKSYPKTRIIADVDPA